ncbi:nucleoside/nucleotide kinase family protein [Deinococcus sp. KSM4-11]|uniref:nucleoside/nucleotide kinase family protein n=1 Tax=Deinococcus sp. KSM4-11 TaxID=2568654 RepID=UPI0010A477F6|nr:nucleoside/nucleotide kinase family protein [Deinococcus sp. KSM4-11]THF87294.1 nucleoside/nucleotide kinase family protein [Deinococcus sp. KSM4-11]
MEDAIHSAPSPNPVQHATVDELVVRARALIVPGERRVLGITGTPGAGKSTLCEALASALGEVACVVPMDGFHLANEELRRLGRQDRKGAQDTFDAGGYAALLTRLRQNTGQVVYAPFFNRALEESIGSAIPVPPQTALILTEGNYLLLDEGEWRDVRAAIDEVWYLEIPDDLRLGRLVRRHETFGRSHDDAVAWVASVDQKNAALIEDTRSRADWVIQLT